MALEDIVDELEPLDVALLEDVVDEELEPTAWLVDELLEDVDDELELLEPADARTLVDEELEEPPPSAGSSAAAGDGSTGAAHPHANTVITAIMILIDQPPFSGENGTRRESMKLTARSVTWWPSHPCAASRH